ncbi:uncharacterized protein [Dysidea avara]|uniref:uncharacterized protein isoform X2 n=1 Tax=Dysidea avara TaxID=196820 RepID=UPI00332388AF
MMCSLLFIFLYLTGKFPSVHGEDFYQKSAPCNVYDNTSCYEWSEFLMNYNMFCCDCACNYSEGKEECSNGLKKCYNMTTTRGGNHTQINNRKISDKSTRICLCQEKGCFNSTNVGTVYPGQSIQLKLQATSYTVALYVDGTYNDKMMPVCDSVAHSTLKSRSKPQVNLVHTNCTTLSYTIRSNSSKWCMLQLRMATSEATLYSYNITLKRCPLGFILHDGLCICDPTFLNAIRGLSCDVQTGTYERPPSSWIAINPNHTDIMYIDQCHYDYCSLATIKVDIHNNSDVQCLSCRNGISCGKCSEGFSAVFGTSASLFNTIIYLSILEFLGIVILYIVKTIINNCNDKVQIRCQNPWDKIKQRYIKLFGNRLKAKHVNIQPDEDDSLLREELIGYDDIN